MSRYRLLGLGVLALALIVAMVARPQRRPAAPPVAEAVVRPDRHVSVVIQGASLEPARTTVPKGARVTVTVGNRDRVPRTVGLLGYEDRVAPASVAPGSSATLRFSADRPGSDFAWLVDGHPAGVFAVSGSHLVEGHR